MSGAIADSLTSAAPLPRARYGADGATSRRQRATAVVLALLISLALPASLWMIGAARLPGKGQRSLLVAVNLGDGHEARPAASHITPQPSHTRASAASAAAVIPPHVEIPTENKLQLPEGFIQMSHDQFARSDISQMHGTPGTASGGEAGGAGHGSGEGPGGVHLYNAEWYREPRDAELNGYLRPGQATGQWAMIACRTIENFHVDNCQELDEEPRGSGMARVLRQAAWQFLVRPPRVNGKAMIGEWVRIRFDFIRHNRADTPDDGR